MSAERLSSEAGIASWTHYTPSQRAMMGAKRSNATRLDGPRRAIGKFTDRIITDAEAAKDAHVGISYVVRAKRLRREAAPEVVRAVAA